MFQATQSSMIAGVEYDPATETLEVTFTNMRRYRYEHVPAVVCGELLASTSKGKFMSRRIIGTYRASEVHGVGGQ